MIQQNNTYSNSDLQFQIWNSVNELNYNQQLKLLDFINSLFLKTEHKNNDIIKFAGIIEKDELETMKISIKDCEKIDLNEW
jgi:hypothetical protein